MPILRLALACLAVAAMLAPRALAQQAPLNTQPPLDTRLPLNTQLPDLGGVADTMLSPQMEKRIGESIVREIRFREPSYLDDPELTEYLANLGGRLTSAAGVRQDFEFFALRDPSINAFALPGGFIGVHTGLLSNAETESEVASVLGHEIAHVTQRHIARLLANQQQAQLPVMVALAAALLLGRSRPDLAMGAVTAAQAGAVSSQLSYTRDFEREADRVGLQTLVAAGFDPRAMSAFFEKLQRSTRLMDDGSVPSYLRTHPMTTERISEAQGRAAGMPYKQHLDPVEFQLVRAKLRTESGDARDAAAYFDGLVRDKRYASEAAARYGLAAAQLRAGRPREAEAELGRLRALRVESPMVEALAARLRLAHNDRAGAIRVLADARARYPRSRALIYYHVGALEDGGRNKEALEALAEPMRSYPRDPKLFTLQARAYASLGRRLQQHQAQAEVYALQGSLPAAIEQLQLARAAGDGDFYQNSVVDARLRELRGQHQQELKDAKR